MSDPTRDPRAIDTPTGGPQDPGLTGGGDVVANEEAPIADRLGRNPANLGDDVADSGDITYPTPQPGGPEM